MQVGKRLHINVGEGYDVIIGHGLLEKSGQFVRDLFGPRNCMIISESNVAPLYLEAVKAAPLLFYRPCTNTVKTLCRRLVSVSDL